MARGAGSLTLMRLFWKVRSAWWAASRLRRRHFGTPRLTDGEQSDLGSEALAPKPAHG
jgi:hypothetical protein